MGRYDIDEAEMEKDDQIFGGGNRRNANGDADQPRRR